MTSIDSSNPECFLTSVVGLRGRHSGSLTCYRLIDAFVQQTRSDETEAPEELVGVGRGGDSGGVSGGAGGELGIEVEGIIGPGDSRPEWRTGCFLEESFPVDG